MDYFNLDTLNEEQRIPAMDTEGAVLVTAGAGSGKTRMLTHRIAHLISNLSISPYNILAITFTNKAASEMKERLFSMLPQSQGLWVSTFHAMCVSILRKFIDKIGYKSNFSIYSETEKERIIKKNLKDRGIEDEDGLSRRIGEYISSAKNEGYSPDDFAIMNKYLRDIDIISSIYAAYEKELKESNSLDFDDLLLYTHKLLKDSDEAREYCQNRFRYIHVDEFQDTNNIQYKLLIQLASKYRNVFVVGDEDQSIYGWRGANIDNIRHFIRDFGAKIYKLEQNYRSTKQILNAANTLISNNNSRIEKNLWTENEDGLDIVNYAAQKDSAEGDYVLSNILSLRGKGYRYSDIAILMRVNALTRGFEQRLLQYGIPYKVFGGFKFFERKEVKDLLAYARMIANPLDNEAITRVINFPKRGIGDAAIKQLQNYSQISGRNLFDIIMSIETNTELPLSLISKIRPFSKIVNYLYYIKDLPADEFLSKVVEATELKNLYSQPTEENQNRMMHVNELISSAEEFSTQNPTADINDYLQMVTLYTDTDEMDGSKDYVNLATVHSAKGLEFPVVFIVGLEEGLFPLSRAVEDNEIEEERRLMYVAITRAKKRLYLTYSRSRFLYGTTKDTIPSRFIEEAGVQMAQPSAFKENNWQQRNSSFSSNHSNYRANNYYGNQNSSFNDDRSKSHPKQIQTRQKQVSFSPNHPQQVENEIVSTYKEGMIVKHKRFGLGKIISIQRVGNNYAEIEFKSGRMTLALNFAPLEIVE